VRDRPAQGDAGAVRRFHRIIPAPIPTRADFRADAAVGKSPLRDPDKGRDWRGCSVFETPAQARAIATEHHLRVRDRIALNFPLSLTARFPHLIGLSPIVPIATAGQRIRSLCPTAPTAHSPEDGMTLAVPTGAANWTARKKGPR